jgi:hydroxymethylpyrimidine/phosphomethylpyrimidine kinase
MIAPAAGAGSGAAGSAATKGLTGMLGITAITTAITSTVEGGMNIHASYVDLNVKKANLDQQPPQNLKIPEIGQK